MLEISRSTEAKTIAAQSVLWESNSSAPISANIDKFKKNLTSEEIEQIETVTGAQMDRFGYARLTPGRSPIDEKILAAAKLRSEEKRTAAWAHLKATKPHDFILRRRRADYIEMCRQNLLRQPFA
jgi:hypothetical protein